MISFGLGELAQLAQGRLSGEDVRFSSVGTDTRTLQPGDLFVAIRGERFDGRDFVAAAEQHGACAILIDGPVETGLPSVEVEDSVLALGRLAAAWRERSTARFVGITGSNGKTTLKEMIAAILSQQDSVLATAGNLNNHIGMPLTLIRVQEQAFAVIEMGANHPGEIAYLTGICRPDVAVLNNAGRAHLEGFGSLEGVARAKGEIVQGLGEHGTFVYNADDRFAGLWQELAAGRAQIGFGVQAAAQVSSPPDSYRIEWSDGGVAAVFDVCTPQAEFSVRLGLAGEHNRMNALAAIAACTALDIAPSRMQAGLAGLRPVPGRLCLVPAASGARLIDDSYNANPESVIAALQVLEAAPGRRTLVLGDLGELGPRQSELHAELGRRAGEFGIERLFSCGRLSAAASDAFAGEGRHFAGQSELIDFLGGDLGASDSVLVKGSRTSGMERVVKALQLQEVKC